PPINTSDPSTTPPPNTRLNSLIFVKILGVSSSLMSFNFSIFCAGTSDLNVFLGPFVSLCSIVSSILFHAPQLGHLPIHFGDWYPQAKHSNITFFFAIHDTSVLIE